MANSLQHFCVFWFSFVKCVLTVLLEMVDRQDLMDSGIHFAVIRWFDSLCRSTCTGVVPGFAYGWYHFFLK